MGKELRTIRLSLSTGALKDLIEEHLVRCSLISGTEDVVSINLGTDKNHFPIEIVVRKEERLEANII